MEHVDALIQGAGVDKVVIKDLPLGEQVARRYGSQAWVFPVDYNGKCVEDVPSAAGEALLTSIDRDGMGKGFDLLALEREWKIPVVLAGGCGRLDHVRQAFDAGADGAAIASMFFFTDKSPIKLRSWLASEGVAVRV
jgi:cyclase